MDVSFLCVPQIESEIIDGQQERITNIATNIYYISYCWHVMVKWF